MKIQYVAYMRLPTEKAHGIQVMHMCEALAGAGHEVELLVPRIESEVSGDPFELSGVRKNFAVRYLPAAGSVRFLGKAGHWWCRFIFAASVFLAAHADIVYGRDDLSLYLLSFAKHRLVFEAHEGRWNFIVRRAAVKAEKLVVITRALSAFFIERGIEKGKIIVEPDAVSAHMIARLQSKEEARAALHLPGPLAVYTGHLYEWKGAGTVAEAAGSIQAAVVLVGGTDADIARFKEKYSSASVRIEGRKPHRDVAAYLAAADVLLLPNSGKEDISRLYTSPLKLFEYMAAGRPIVASDLPSIREILSDDMAYFFKPDDARDLARAVNEALTDPERDKRAERAKREVEQYTWDKRAERILAQVAKGAA